MSQQSLKDKTIKGTMWSGIDNIAQFGIRFLIGIILARLLSPDDYGLLGIVAIFTALCDVIINGGFQIALIRKKDVTDDDYNTVFICNLGMSILLYAAIYLYSPLIAAFFGREELVALTRVSSLSMIIFALSLVQQVRLTKRIDFKTQTKISVSASIVSGIVGITMAFLGFGVWALVAQTLLSSTLRTILLWIANKWIPALRFSVDSFRNLFGFGWKMMIAGIMDSVYKQLYQVIVGKYYSPASLGQYSRAKNFSEIFSTNLTNVIQRVTFPVLSDIQDEPERMISAYRRIIKLTMFVTFTCMIFLAAISEPLIYCLIGQKWHDAAVYLPLICFVGMLYPLHAINLNMLEVLGRSDLFLGLEIVKKIIGVAPLAVGALIGILPMLCTSIVTSIMSYFINSYFPGKLLGYSSWKQIKDIAPSFTTATITALSVFFLKYLPLTHWIILPLQLVVGVSVFLIVCNMWKLEEYKEAKSIISGFTSKFRKK